MLWLNEWRPNVSPTKTNKQNLHHKWLGSRIISKQTEVTIGKSHPGGSGVAGPGAPAMYNPKNSHMWAALQHVGSLRPRVVNTCGFDGQQFTAWQNPRRLGTASQGTTQGAGIFEELLTSTLPCHADGSSQTTLLRRAKHCNESVSARHGSSVTSLNTIPHHRGPCAWVKELLTEEEYIHA